MVDYLPLYIMIFIVFHMILIRQVNHAREPLRLAMAGRFNQLCQADAPAWLLDFWTYAMGDPSCAHGRLKWAMLVRLVLPVKLMKRVHAFKHDVNKLDPKLKEIHDHMDRDLAIVLLLSSPYFSTLLVMFALLFKGTVELARLVPEREARAEFVKIQAAA